MPRFPKRFRITAVGRTPKSPTGRSARRRPVSPDDAPPRPPPARGANWPRGRCHGIAIRIPAPLFVKDASADRRRLAGVDQIPIRQLRTDLPVGDFGVRPTPVIRCVLLICSQYPARGSPRQWPPCCQPGGDLQDQCGLLASRKRSQRSAGPRRSAPWNGSAHPGYSGARALTSSNCLSSSWVSVSSTAARLS